MHIPRNSWHYRVWKFTYVFGGEGGFETPEQTNLCRYVSRTLLYPVPIFLAIALVIIAIGGTLFILPNVATILLGFGILAPGERGDVYRRRPFLRMSVIGRRIPIWMIVCPTWLLITLAVFVTFFPSQMVTAVTYAAYGVVGGTIMILGFYVLYLVIAIVISACRRWEGWDVAKEYVKAKKQRFCPVIVFDETKPHAV